MKFGDVARRAGVWVMFAIAFLVIVVLAAAGYGPFLIALAIGATIAIAIVRRPQFGILLLLVLAPFDGLRLLVEIPVVGAAWKFVIAGFVLAATFVCPKSARAPRRKLPPWVLPLTLMILIGLASAVAVGPVQGLVGLKLDFAYLLVAAAAWRCPLDARDRDRLVTILMVTGFICAVGGIAQQLLGERYLHDTLGYEYDITIRFIGNSLRSFSTFTNAPAFALYLMIVLLIGLPHLFSERGRPRNRLFLFALPVYALGLGSAFTRSALLGLGAGLLYLGLRRYRVLIAALPLVLLVFLLFGGNVTETLGSSSSLGERTSGWQENIEQVAAHPLGAGIGAVGSAAETVAELNEFDLNRYQPDNYYFKTVYELGLLGLWMFILVLIGAFASVFRAADHRAGRDRALADGVAGAFVAALVAATVTAYLEIFPMDLLFWLLITVVATMDARPVDAPEQSPLSVSTAAP
jgi:hypothetical protein